MKHLERIQPISYLKSHCAEVAKYLQEQQEPLVITQNGKAVMVVQDINSYEQTQETLMLLKILALGNRQIEDGKVQTVAEAFKNLRKDQSRR